MSRQPGCRAFAAIALALLASAAGFASAGARAPAADASVTIVDFAFNPTTTTVTVGSTVHWTHTGMAPHTVTADNGFFDSGRLTPGGTFDFTFPRVATYTYKCMIHPALMTGTIAVTASTAAPATTAVAPAATTAASAGAAAGQSVAFKAGVNLVGVPAGTAITPSVVYAFDATTQQYTAIQPGEIKNGKGYWAYFDSAPTVSLAAGVATAVSIDAPAGIYTTIGNPSSTGPATVTGADAVYTYNASSGQYVATKTLQPGDGAWAISLKGGQITITQATGTPTAPASSVSGAPQLRATATGATTIRLDWTDGSAAASGYAIYDNANGQLVDTVPGTVTTYTLQGLSPGVAYCEYVVTLGTAVNSAPSNAVCATTPVS